MVLSQYAPLWDNCKDRANFGGLGSNKMKKPTFGKKNANKKHGADLSPFDWHLEPPHDKPSMAR